MNILRLAIFTLLVSVLLVPASSAQDITGSTTIDIDPDTGNVLVTCVTEPDDTTLAYYQAAVTCTVYGNGVFIGRKIGTVVRSGDATAAFSFAGVPGTTYTATGTHSAKISYLDEDFTDTLVPTDFYDAYNFSSFESPVQTYPDTYDWFGPGPPEGLTTSSVQTGNTTTTAFASTPPQHNYPNTPFSFACWISSFFDATRTTGAHHADDVTQSTGGTSHVAPPLGTPVYAMESGRVVVVSTGQPAAAYPACSSLTRRPDGDYAKIQGTDSYTTLYFHMNPSVTVGQQVIAGQQIGVLDNSGCQSAPHLHVGRKDSQGNIVNFTIPCVNPLPSSATKFNDGSIDDNDPDDW